MKTNIFPFLFILSYPSYPFFLESREREKVKREIDRFYIGGSNSEKRSILSKFDSFFNYCGVLYQKTVFLRGQSLTKELRQRRRLAPDFDLSAACLAKGCLPAEGGAQ